MDLDIVVFWLALTIVAGTFLSTRGHGGWSAVTGLVIVGAPILLYVAPQPAPWIVFGIVTVFVVVPALLMRAAMVQHRRQQYRAAWLLGWAAAILHPMDGWPGSARVFGALTMLGRGQDGAARAKLERVATQFNDVGLAAKAQLCRLDNDWQAVLDDPRMAGDSVAMVPLRLRALGEVGRAGDMAAVFRRAEPALRRAGPHMTAQALLCITAFGGRPQAVGALLAGPLSGLPEQQKRLWTSTAQIASGGPAASDGSATLRDLASSADPDTRRLARARLARSPQDATNRAGVDDELLARLETEILASPVAVPRRRRMKQNLVTSGLCAANIAVFVAEWISGSPEDDETLYRLGALFTPAVVQGGEWWRLFTAMFLHAGIIHLAANMLALIILGSVVEPLFGRWKYCLLYFGAGLGSMASIVALASAGLMHAALLVGASGAIMGLIGGLGAAAVRQWLAEPSALARQRLLRVGLALVLQTGIDLTTPRISFTAHISGTCVGFVVGWLMRVRWRTLDTAGAFGAGPATQGAAPVTSMRRAILYAIVGAAVAASLWVAAYR